MDFKEIGCVLALLTLAVSFGHAQPSGEFKDWAASPEGFLLTKKEAKAWESVENDHEAKEFIDLFWARRNPNPEAPYNQFRAKYYAMVKHCDEEFSYEGKRGALTDRGKVSLLMGQPHQAQRRAPTEYITSTSTATGQSGAGTDQVRANAAMWVYDPARMNPAFKVKGSRILFTFYETRPNTNQFTLDRSHREATMALRALKKAPEVYLLHPDLECVPKPVSVPGGTPASAAEITALGDAVIAPAEVLVTAEMGVADARHRPLWVHVGTPAAGEPMEFFSGRVLTSDGQEVLSTFRFDAKAMENHGRNAYHLTFPLTTGDYRIEFGGFSKGSARFVERRQISIPPPEDAPWLSEIWVGLEASRKEGALLGEAFTFGAWHLHPLDATTVEKGDRLSYFGYFVVPEPESEEPTQVRLKLSLRKDGQRLGHPLSLDLPVAKVTDGVFLYANALDLGALPTGPCILDFKVTAPGTDLEVERRVELEIE